MLLLLWMALPLAQSQPCTSCGTSTAITYDANGNVASRTDFNGNRTEYTFDLARNLEIQRIEAKGAPEERTITTEWHPTFRLITRQAEPLRITTYEYDDDGSRCGARGALCRKTLQATTDTTGAQGFSATLQGTSRIWRYRYNRNGQVIRVDGARTDVPDITRYTYYPNDDPDFGKRGNLATITNALGHVTTITAYDAHGNPLSITDPNGLVTVLAYDARQRLLARTVGTETTLYAYDGVGQLKKVTLPDTSFLAYTYDAAHRLTNIEDNLGNTITYVLDAMGNRTEETITDPHGVLTQKRKREYNALNRLVVDEGAAGQKTVYTHDDQGNVKTITDPLQHVTTQSFDALNRLKEMLDPKDGKTTYTYDGLDHIASITDPRNLTTHYTTTGLDNRTQTESPDTGTTIQTFDRAGNLKTATDARGERQGYTYDALNRPIKMTNPLRLFTYDEGVNGLGHLTTLTDPAGVTQWAYDSQGRVIDKTHALDAVTLGVQYHYNAVGQMQEVVYPSGKTVTYSYDAANRVQSVSVNGTPILTTMQYQPFGAPTSWSWGNGTPYSRSFDLDGRLASYPLGATIRTLSFDDASRIIGFTHSDATPPQTFDYDVLDRLTRFNSLTDTYTYDEVGNRTTLRLGNTDDTYTYAATSNQLNTITGTHATTYTYDAAGNTETAGTRTYSYDGRQRLIKVTEGGNTSRYYINALGQRMKKSSSGQGSTRFMYDESGHLLGEYKVTGQARQEIVWLGDRPVAVLRGNQIYYIYADHLNTPRVITDTTNTVVWRWNHDEPFGNNPAEDDPDGNGQRFVFNLRFPGQYADRETGLYYNYFRDYDPSVGRYVQSDPIGLEGGINTYTYVDNNPLYYSDPLGLAEMCYRPVQGYVIPGQHCFARFNHDNKNTLSFDLEGVHPDPKPEGATCEEMEGAQDDDCIKIEMKKCQDYHFTKFNCCHCVEQAMNACGQSIPVKSWPNWPINPGPKPGEPGYKR
jgi:RHS repeat-associated protein